MLLDSGTSCSVMRSKLTVVVSISIYQSDCARFSCRAWGIITVDHTLVVVEKLSTPVILGCDFLTTHGVTLDFKAILKGNLLLQSPHSCMLILDDEHPQAMPSAVENDTIDMPYLQL